MDLDSEPEGEGYPIAYDAIFAYVDEGASTFDDFANRIRQEPLFDEDEEEEGADDNNHQTRFRKTADADWSKIDVANGAAGRVVEPIPWTGGEEQFSVKITEEELDSLKSNGRIMFEKVFEWSLPLFGNNDEVPLFEWQAARMRNYMTKIMKDPEIQFKPRYYKPDIDKVITSDHVARFYGCLIAKMLAGNPSIEQAFSTRDVFNAVEPMKEAMTKNAMQDLSRCLHFADDWNDDDWTNEYFDSKDEAKEDTAQHRKKFALLEDAYNKRWQAMVNFGKWLTADESRVAGWYKSVMTVGPEPKPIRTGATLHSLCVTEGSLRTYKLFVRVYGGKLDGDLARRHENTETKLKFVSLYDIMLDSFKGQGHCMVMDSAYMGDVMALIGRHVWKINMVGTVQSNRTGAGKMASQDLLNMEAGSYESIFYQHKTENLTYAVWSDNNFVKTLSNFHTPAIAVAGVYRKKRDADSGRRDLTQSEVDCPEQQKTYCETYHWIDKSNGAEAKFDLGGESHRHGWTPKLAARLFNMNLNNAYRIYCALIENENYKADDFRSCVSLLALSLLSRGEPMRVRSSGVAPTGTSGSPEGRKIRSDARGHFNNSPGHPQGRNHPQTPQSPAPISQSTVKKRRKTFENLIEIQPWRSHQSVATVCANDGQHCVYSKCPGLLRTWNKRIRSFPTRYSCNQCSIEQGRTVFLCNTTKKQPDGKYKPILCHINYHTQQSNRDEY
jgi:hypothetical protein